MPAASDRLDFAPPAPPGRWRALALAILAHLLLLLALTWGINWKRDNENLAAEAELWSPTVQQAAPKAVEAPPPPPEPAQVKEQPAPPPPTPSQADIALEQEKKRLAEEKRREDELARQKKLAEQKKQEELRKQEVARKAAEDRKRQEAEQAKAKAREQEDAKRLEALRQENLKRIQGLAGATGTPGASGTALRSSGPTDSYAGRIRAKVRPNIVFTDDVAGNPSAEVEVRMAPDGTITSKRIVKSSGSKSWDEAVLRALDRTEVLPRDVDGRVHSPLLIEFRPKG